MAPDAGHSLEGLVIEHALTRTVRDCAALLDATAGPAPGDPYAAAAPAEPWLAAIGRDPGRLRIAWNTEAPFDGTTDPEVRAAVESVARSLEGLGHELTPAAPDFDRDAVVDAVAKLHQVSNLELYALAEAALGRPPERDELEPTAWEMLEEGRSVTGEQYFGAIGAVHAQGRRFAEGLAGADAFLVPALLCAGPPPLAHLNQPRGSTQEFFRVEFATTGWTADGQRLGLRRHLAAAARDVRRAAAGHPADGAAGDRAASARRAARARRRAEVRPQPAGEPLGGHARRKPVGAGLAGSGLSGRSAAGVSAL